MNDQKERRINRSLRLLFLEIMECFLHPLLPSSSLFWLCPVFHASALHPQTHKPYLQTPKPWRTIDGWSLGGQTPKYSTKS